MTRRIRKAVIPAAGLGTRFLPATKAIPKELLPIVNKPVLQYVVEELVDAGITDIILVTSANKRAIEDHFDAPSSELATQLKQAGESKQHLLESVERLSGLANFIYVRQKGPYGNGTPLMNVEHLVGDEPFIYTWSDDFIVATPSRFQQLIELYQTHGVSVLGCVRATSDRDYDRYGFAAGDELSPDLIDVREVVEKPGKSNAPSELATVSGFLFTPEIFDYIRAANAARPEGRELWYNDALKLMLADRHRILAAAIRGGRYYDTGDVLEYLKTVVELGIDDSTVGRDFYEWLRAHLARA